MTQKSSQARKTAFLSALSETGNQTLAAERAKVSRSWVQLQRREDPAFRVAVHAPRKWEDVSASILKKIEAFDRYEERKAREWWRSAFLGKELHAFKEKWGVK